LTSAGAVKTFRVRLRRGGFEFEVESSDQAYVDQKVAELTSWLGLEPAETPLQALSGAVSAAASPAKPPSLVEHVRRVGPSNGLEHVLAVGYYLEHHRKMAGGFRRRDLGHAFNAMGYNHSNPGVPIAAARRQGLLMDGAETDKIRLSESADEWVRARLRGD
jgi:hypothetical protein